MEQKQAKSWEEHQEYLSERLSHIVKHAYENAPAIKNRLDAVGIKPDDIKTIKDLERIPVLAKDELVRLQNENPPFGGFLAVPIESLERIFLSPGPLFDAGIVKERAKMAAEIFSSVRLGKGDRVVNTFSYHFVPAGYWVDEAVRMMGGTVIPTGVGNTDLQIKVMHDLGVTGYTGTPSFLNIIIKRAEELDYNFRRDFKLRFAILTAEMLPPSLRRSFEDDYGIKVVECYGTADVGLISYECDQKAGMHLVEDAIIEIVDPVTGKQLGSGEIGEVVVTTFDEAYTLIRLGTGDLSYFTDAPCKCGRISPRLVRIVGRVGDAVKIRAMFVHPNQVKQVMANFPQVTNFQLIVDRVQQRDVTTLKLEVEEGANKEGLSQGIKKAFPEICTVKADSIEFIPGGTLPAERKIILDQRTWE